MFKHLRCYALHVLLRTTGGFGFDLFCVGPSVKESCPSICQHFKLTISDFPTAERKLGMDMY